MGNRAPYSWSLLLFGFITMGSRNVDFSSGPAKPSLAYMLTLESCLLLYLIESWSISRGKPFYFRTRIEQITCSGNTGLEVGKIYLKVLNKSEDNKTKEQKVLWLWVHLGSLENSENICFPTNNLYDLLAQV